MSLLSALTRDNPWWTNATTITADPDLRRLASQAVQFVHAIPFDLGMDAVYTLRGPRQVGKSTLLKQIAAELITRREIPPRNVMYLDVEGAGITTHLRLQQALTNYLDWIRSSDPNGRVYLLLDEVTGVQDWGTAPRVLYRRGALEGVTMIVTGSHALDIMHGGETAPGRRGERHVADLDWILMPASFRDYVHAHAPDVIAQIPALDIFDPRQAYLVAQEIMLHDAAVTPLFTRYLQTGGYPHAAATEQAEGRIPTSVYQLYRDAITGQMKRARHREGIFREIVAWVGDHRLGKEFSWRDVSAETDIGSKDTAREYIEDAEAMFLWHVYYRAQHATSPTPALRSPKKLYPADPFAWHVLSSWTTGDQDPWTASTERLTDPIRRGDLVESVLADHARRRFGSFALYHRAPQGEEEIDIVAYAGGQTARIEVKYRKRVSTADERFLAKYGGGIVATVDELAYDPASRVARIPLAVLLVGDAVPATLFPAKE
jgi:uncharacterized protein